MSFDCARVGVGCGGGRAASSAYSFCHARLPVDLFPLEVRNVDLINSASSIHADANALRHAIVHLQCGELQLAEPSSLAELNRFLSISTARIRRMWVQMQLIPAERFRHAAQQARRG